MISFGAPCPCPKCGSHFGVDGDKVTVSYGTWQRHVGRVRRCVECGEAFYALKGGLSFRAYAKREVAPAPTGPQIVLPEKQRKRGVVGMSDMIDRPVER